MGREGFPSQRPNTPRQPERTPEDVLLTLKHRAEALPAPAEAGEVAPAGEESGFDLQDSERVELRETLKRFLGNIDEI